MKIICNFCKYEYESEDDITTRKCPRCNKIITKELGCENCKGCSFSKKCN